MDTFFYTLFQPPGRIFIAVITKLEIINRLVVYMESFLGPLLIMLFPIQTSAQAVNNSDSSYFISLNQLIDDYVVQGNAKVLDTLYAEDFIFSHGTGLIEDKKAG